MKAKDRKRFREILMGRRNELISSARRTREEEMSLDQDDMPDEMDLAGSEYNQSMVFRLRGREKVLLRKIDDALERLEAGEYGICEECGGEIAAKRLEARPVTTLCIRCKEEQEKAERDFS